MKTQFKYKSLENNTINDFGEQWMRFTENEGYYGSVEVLQDILFPLMKVDEIEGKKIAEIGSGTGRIVRMLYQACASEITAIEPSDAINVLKENTKDLDKVRYIHASGTAIPKANFDMIFVIGVIHHIPQPDEVLRAAYKALRPGGKIIIWIYGKEGNELYLMFYHPLKIITKRTPDWLLSFFCSIVVVPLSIYAWLCRFFNLPMRKYMRGHIAKLSWHVKKLTIFDQLNPTWAKYYNKEEAEALVKRAGFSNIQLHHRHGYSWTIVGERPY